MSDARNRAWLAWRANSHESVLGTIEEGEAFNGGWDAAVELCQGKPGEVFTREEVETIIALAVERGADDQSYADRGISSEPEPESCEPENIIATARAQMAGGTSPSQ